MSHSLERAQLKCLFSCIAEFLTWIAYGQMANKSRRGVLVGRRSLLVVNFTVKELREPMKLEGEDSLMQGVEGQLGKLTRPKIRLA